MAEMPPVEVRIRLEDQTAQRLAVDVARAVAIGLRDAATELDHYADARALDLWEPPRETPTTEEIEHGES